MAVFILGYAEYSLFVTQMLQAEVVYRVQPQPGLFESQIVNIHHTPK